MSGVEVVTAPSGRELHLHESVAFSAPLGLRFWDATLDRQVIDGLRVTAAPSAGGDITLARQGSSGIYGFVNLPTTATDEDGPVADFGPTTPYRIDVADSFGRFATFGTIEVAPQALGTTPVIYLYSGPQRSTPAGFAEVRASMRIGDSTIKGPAEEQFRPAAHARVEITEGPTTTVGFADSNGELLVLVPLLDLVAGQPLHLQTTDVTIAVFFDPAREPGPQTPIIEDLFAQPAHVHLAGPAIAADGSASIGVTEKTVLKSSASSFLLLQPL